MKAICILSFFALIACSLADRNLCPHPPDAVVQIVEQFLSVDAIDAYAVAVELDMADSGLTTDKVTCYSVVSEEDGSGPVAMSIGQNRWGSWSLRMISALSKGIRASVSMYGPEPTEEEEVEPEVKLAKTKFHRLLKQN